MRTKTIITILSGWMLLSLAGCDPKDPIYNTPHPDHGTITLTTDWSGIGEGLTAPESYTVRVGEYSVSLSGNTHTLNNYFLPATYRAYVYNTPEHIAVNDATASVAAAATPAGQSGTFVNAAPGWLHTCALDAAIEKDTDHSFTAVMQQQVRQLTLIIEPTGGSTERIESIVGRLSGVASSLDLANNTHAAPANVEVRFTRQTSGEHSGKWAATVRLLGVAGSQQRLTATVTFTDGNPGDMPLDSDLSAALSAFNTDKRTPLTLVGTIAQTPDEAGFTATVTDWEVGEGDEGTAELIP